MLYDVDDYDKYGLVKRPKLNIIKVFVFLCIILGALAIIFFSFFISYKKINDNQIQELSKLDDNNSEKINEKNEKEKDKKNKGKKTNIYNGKHVQIAIHDEESIKLKFVPNANPNAQNEIKSIYGSDEKQVYLTFDDGPSKDITPQILDILKEEDVPATFFVLGSRVELYPETLQREFKEGHYIANHGYSHQYSKVYASRDTTFQEYVECENSIKNALNNQDYNTYLFRFPGGSSGGMYSGVKAEARELFSNYGVAYTNWNCLTGDAAGNTTKEDCFQELVNTKGNQSSLIVLMHDANDKQYTVDGLREIIQYFKNDGYVFKNFYEIFK